MSDCACNTGIKLIYSCSGAADVGELADRAVRVLRKDGIAQGSCIAGIGAGLSGYVQSAKGADMTIAIDGCPVACVKKNLEKIGVKPVAVNLAELGYKKGESPFSEELLSSVVADLKNAINKENQKENTGTSEQSACGCGGNC